MVQEANCSVALQFLNPVRAKSELDCVRPPPQGRQGLQPLGCEGSGSVQSGPSLVCGSGTLIMARGPALCSPLKGVNLVGSLAGKPQAAASFELLNQNPR